MGFRCTAVVGNGNGLVGVGCQSGREIATAVKRALVDAKKAVVRVSAMNFYFGGSLCCIMKCTFLLQRVNGATGPILG